ncbi:hypothetical protein ABFS82_02G069000 [Erythranthe guttata]
MQNHDITINREISHQELNNNTPNSIKKIRKRRIINCGKITSNEIIEQNRIDQEDAKKKMEHNAKERIRRMKLNASYLALRELMPRSRRSSKKRWAAPAIVDKVLEYIPELKSEIEALRSKKESANIIISAAKNKNIIPTSKCQLIPAVLLNKINQEEATVQISIARSEGEEYDQNGYLTSLFTNLLQRLEDEGICVKNASTLYVYESRLICYNLHIQVILIDQSNYFINFLLIEVHGTCTIPARI